MIKRVALFGSTGSIGTQSLQVIDENENFEVEVLTAHNNYKLLIKQALKYKPNVVVISNIEWYAIVRDSLEGTDIKVYAGDEALCQVTSMSTIDIIVMGIVGIHALKPLLAAVKNGKTIALANKESLVVAGKIIKDAVISNKARIIPVDSEHSAIFQCLLGERDNEIEKIVLTASGGPFLNFSYEQLKYVKPKDALAHPNWNMGNRVSVDSATLMNKGMEAIEASWLFDLNASQIDVIVHPQSIIHSMVYFVDGTIKALLSYHDMKIPIQYALTFPERHKNKYSRFDLTEIGNFSFQKPDIKKFCNLALAFEALKTGGNMPCVVNASNDVAVSSFLSGEISFTDISTIVEKCMTIVTHISSPDLDALLVTDSLTREKAKDIINKLTK